MLTQAQADRLAELHKSAVNAMRDSTFLLTCTSSEWMSACEALGATQSAFAAYLASLTQPVGMVCVPVEPTKEMVIAGDDALMECKDYSWDSRDECGHEELSIRSDAPAQIYRAMIAAAPGRQTAGV